jgi:hypothetical protein
VCRLSALFVSEQQQQWIVTGEGDNVIPNRSGHPAVLATPNTILTVMFNNLTSQRSKLMTLSKDIFVFNIP